MQKIAFKNANLQDKKCQKRKFAKQEISKTQNFEANIVKKDKFARQKVSKMKNLYDPPGLPYPTDYFSVSSKRDRYAFFCLFPVVCNVPRHVHEWARYYRSRETIFFLNFIKDSKNRPKLILENIILRILVFVC